MHNRGKAECLEAIYPTGRVETLSCAKFRFNWHLNYVYADDAAPLLPAGTVLHSIMWHDNTAKNPFNPDPDAQITYGQRTIDEMASAWISWYYMSDEDFRKETEARRAPRSHGHELTLRRGIGMKKYHAGDCFFRFPARGDSRTSVDAQVGFARGQDVSPTFDGWQQNADGTFTLHFGYFNRNSEEEFDVPDRPGQQPRYRHRPWPADSFLSIAKMVGVQSDGARRTGRKTGAPCGR